MCAVPTPSTSAVSVVKKSKVKVNSLASSCALASSLIPSVSRSSSLVTDRSPVRAWLVTLTFLVVVPIVLTSVTVAPFTRSAVEPASRALPWTSWKADSFTRTLKVTEPFSWMARSPSSQVMVRVASSKVTDCATPLPASSESASSVTPAGSVSVTVTVARVAAPVESMASLFHLTV